jgi:small subunit ribosomal protein S7
MAGRITNSEAQLRPDPKFNDKVLAKFTNCIMFSGRKTAALRVVYDAIDVMDDRLKKYPDAVEGCETGIQVFRRAVENVKPYVEVRSKRIGGANYQVPMQVKPGRQQSLSFRWIIAAALREGAPDAREACG